MIKTIMTFAFVFLFFAEISLGDPQPIDQVRVIISVDWEGLTLNEVNIEAMKNFRNNFPNVKMVHFLNAAYFLKPGVNKSEIAKQIKAVLRSGDEIGLHIHAIETLLEASHVAYRENETFYGKNVSDVIDGIRGHDVPLSLFTEDELRRIIRTSIKILHENGFNKASGYNEIQSFRAGGWVASSEVLSALAAEGFKIDSSAVPPDIVKMVFGEEGNLYKIVNKLWSGVSTENAKTLDIQTRHGVIHELVNNFGLADYISGSGVYNRFIKLYTSSQRDVSHPLIVHYGFHQETAAQFLPNVKEAILKIQNYLSQYRVDFAYETLEENLENQKTSKMLSCELIY
jgi:hypothetical protein